MLQNFKKIFYLIFLITCIVLSLQLTGCGSGSINYSQLNRCENDSIISTYAECKTETNSIIKIELLDEEDNLQFCTGALIDSKTILTAAHCFNEFVFNAFVNTEKGKIKVVSVDYHPKFEQSNIDSDSSYDLAYAKLESEIPNSDPLQINFDPKLNIGDQIVFFGFGRLDQDDPKSAGKLTVGTMKINSINDRFITGTVEKHKKNICYGDSGGPVFISNNINSGIIAVISRGSHESCKDSTQAYFTSFNDMSTKDFLQKALITK